MQPFTQGATDARDARRILRQGRSVCKQGFRHYDQHLAGVPGQGLNGAVASFRWNSECTCRCIIDLGSREDEEVLILNCYSATRLHGKEIRFWKNLTCRCANRIPDHSDGCISSRASPWVSIRGLRNPKRRGSTHVSTTMELAAGRPRICLTSLHAHVIIQAMEPQPGPRLDSAPRAASVENP